MVLIVKFLSKSDKKKYTWCCAFIRNTDGDDFKLFSLQSFMMVVQRPSHRGSGGLGPSLTYLLQYPAPKALSVRTHSCSRVPCDCWKTFSDLFLFLSLQAQPSDIVMRREGGWSQTFTTAPHLRLWSSTLLYVYCCAYADKRVASWSPKPAPELSRVMKQKYSKTTDLQKMKNSSAVIYSSTAPESKRIVI